MSREVYLSLVLTACVMAAGLPALAANKLPLKEGTVQLQSAGPLAFAPEGVLLVGDPEAAALYAIATDDTSGSPERVEYTIENVGDKLAAALGTTPRDLQINDLAVNPISGNAYLSVSRGQTPVLLRINPDGDVREVSLKKVAHDRTELPNPPAPGGEGRDNRRAQAITDLAYHDGRVIVAGLSNEEFASTLVSIPYPFEPASAGTSVEIFHGAHGRFETRSPVRTFATYTIQNEPHLLAAYTCTPLVKFPLRQLEPGSKVKGTTVAELGNRNRPLDMFVYQQGGKDYILMANSARGVMKISTEDIDKREGIESKIAGTAGQPYETISDLKGVMQLDRLNSENALVVVQAEDGAISLRTIELP